MDVSRSIGWRQGLENGRGSREPRPFRVACVAASHPERLQRWQLAFDTCESQPRGLVFAAMGLDQLLDLVIANRWEILAVIFGIASVYLSTREHIWSWPTGIVNVSLYFVVFLEAKLYADMGLQVVYLILSVYGWYEWLYGGENRTELHVSRVTRSLGVRLAVMGIVGAALLGTALARFTDAALPYLDSATTTTSLVAQWMMTRKILENWAVWVVVDVVYIGMFIFKHLYLTAGLYAVFLVLAASGYIQWKRSLAERERETGNREQGTGNREPLSA